MRRMNLLYLGGLVGYLGASASFYGMSQETMKSQTPAPVSTISSEGRSIPVQSSSGGMFYVDGRVNDIPVRFIVDSGAYKVNFNAETAKRLGLKWEDGKPVCYWTANGDTCGVDMIVDEINIGGIVIKRVDVLISEPGKLRINLLGMSFLGRLSSFEYSRSKNNLTLVE